MSFPELETERLKLIQIKNDHIPAIYEILSRDDVTRYYGMDSLTHYDEALQMVRTFQHNYDTKRGIRWGIIWKDTRAFIGTVGFHNWSLWNQRAEIGYELHPDYWRKGIAKEAVSAVLTYGFKKMELKRVGAVTFIENYKSSKLLKKLGFMEEGILRGYLYQNKRHYDGVLFSLLSNEWVEKITTADLKLSGQRGLLGLVPPRLRGVTAKVKNHTLHWRCYFDGEPTEEEKELLRDACNYVMNDFPSIQHSVEEYINLPSPEIMDNLHMWLYLRWEKRL